MVIMMMEVIMTMMVTTGLKRCISDDSGVHDTYKQMVIGDDDHNGEDCGWNREEVY